MLRPHAAILFEDHGRIPSRIVFPRTSSQALDERRLVRRDEVGDRIPLARDALRAVVAVLEGREGDAVGC